MKSNKHSTIPLCEPVIGKEDIARVSRCLESGFVSSCGPNVTEFEKKFSDYVGAKYAIATSCGTAAIHAALTNVGTDPGSAVVVSDLTFVASVNPVIHHGATPILCDSEYSSWCMDPDVLDDVLTRNKKSNECPITAIIPVHLFGRPCRIDRIIEIAAKHSIPVIEDATESLGSRLNGKMCGTWGELGCYSFNGNKIITSGAGGMVVTDSQERARHIRHIVNQARSDKQHFIHSEAGYNFRMSNLAASLGLAQLEKIDEFISAKKRIAAEYNKAFAGLPGIELHKVTPNEDSCFWLYSVLTHTHEMREQLISVLNKRGVQSRRFFEPLHKQPYIDTGIWSRRNGAVSCNTKGVSDDISERGLNLPCSVNLNAEDQQRVIDLTMPVLQSAHSSDGYTYRLPLEVPAQ